MLLIWALNDCGVVIDRAFELLDHIPNGELHVISNSAHNVMNDRAADINHLLKGWCIPTESEGCDETINNLRDIPPLSEVCQIVLWY